RVPGAVLWVTMIFIVRLLPFIGGTLADGITIIAALIGLPLPLAIAAIALVTLGQVLLTNVLMPRVMSRELGINPLVVLFAVLMGARIYGVAGILFAIPAASVLATITGRAVNRYLAPLYERRGWWQEEVTVAQRHDNPVDPVLDAHRPTLDVPRPTLEEVI
ncbi:MAG: AI-2E family transporter, partial [Herpetosiphonaceae bacterium]|nr:AI-2E family transporter [Herpetosiphonaceae bacterium]